jgi:hypothetical protein
MKSYKLIKEYPGSDSAGLVVSLKTPNGMYEGWAYNYYTKHVENNPEYWEEVIEKDYEILSYLKKGSTTCTTTKRRGGENHDEYWNIYSVRRLSDGEVFSVGDLIKTPYTDCTPITGFSTKYSTEYFIEVSTGFTRLLSLEKVKQPIFLTHDGKDIFPEDTVWYVNKENLYYDYIKAYPEVKFNSEIRAYFLTEEAAVDYIKKNKVLFTTEDGVGIKKGDTYFFVDTDFSINLSNAHPGCGQYSERKYFSTFETAQYYVIVNAKVLSIEEFWEFVSKPGSNVVKQKALKRLVKQRLKIE